MKIDTVRVTGTHKNGAQVWYREERSAMNGGIWVATRASASEFIQAVGLEVLEQESRFNMYGVVDIRVETTSHEGACPMRCPDCNKFVSYDTEAEPEANTEEFTVSGNTIELDMAYNRSLPCGECGAELKAAEILFEGCSIELVLEEDMTPPEDGKPFDECSHDNVDVEFEAEPTVGAVTKTRTGKQINNPRYIKTLYGVEVQVQARCNDCGAIGGGTFKEEVQASSFDEVC